MDTPTATADGEADACDGAIRRGGLTRIPDAPKPDMPCRRVRRRGRARRVAIAPAIGGMAKITAAAHGAVLVVVPAGAPLPAVADDVVESEIVLFESID